ncbi:MAG: antitoxin [Gammaproteobacteria bacterium]|nr:MAG: antitoxin [Gammaproteobacteria bacterium]
MANLQVKSIDEQLYKSLGRRAALENRSISQEVVSILKDYLSKPSTKHAKTNEQFMQLCGSWVDDKSAEQISKEIRNSRSRSKHRDISL